jgi:hypothetical protein
MNAGRDRRPPAWSRQLPVLFMRAMVAAERWIHREMAGAIMQTPPEHVAHVDPKGAEYRAIPGRRRERRNRQPITARSASKRFSHAQLPHSGSVKDQPKQLSGINRTRKGQPSPEVIHLLSAPGMIRTCDTGFRRACKLT